MGNVRNLEANPQQEAAEHLCSITKDARNGDRKAQNYLKKLWPECSWDTIKERLNTGSPGWYLWWIDGVDQHRENLIQDKK